MPLSFTAIITVDSSELKARFLVNGSHLGATVGRLDSQVRQETQEVASIVMPAECI
jgi:hypothetical protein